MASHNNIETIMRQLDSDGSAYTAITTRYECDWTVIKHNTSMTH